MCLVPSKPPLGPHAVNMSGPHSIPVSWEPVPEGFVHGVLLGYRIFYTVKSIAGEDVRKLTVNTTTNETALRTTLSDLQNYAIYEIKVTAFTVKGDGAISHSITAGLCKKKTVSILSGDQALISGGSVSEWLGCGTRNLKVVGSNPALTTKL